MPEAAIKEVFEAHGWDYVNEISLPFLNFDETFLARNSFIQPFFATNSNTVGVLSQRPKGRVIVVRAVPSM